MEAFECISLQLATPSTRPIVAYEVVTSESREQQRTLEQRTLGRFSTKEELGAFLKQEGNFEDPVIVRVYDDAETLVCAIVHRNVDTIMAKLEE